MRPNRVGPISRPDTNKQGFAIKRGRNWILKGEFFQGWVPTESISDGETPQGWPDIAKATHYGETIQGRADLGCRLSIESGGE